MMNVKWKLLNAVALLAMFSAFEVNAQTANLNVSAEVPEVCQVVTPNVDMAFGSLDVVSGAPGDYSLTSSFQFSCSQGTTLDVALDLGLGPAATLAARQMRGTNDVNNVLPYYLERAAVDGGGDFGSTTGAGGNTVARTASGINSVDSVDIIGTVTLADIQAANADSYADTVVISLVLN